jgi:alkylation response protein AidB-like acyl-CoA dehydrogenase
MFRTAEQRARFLPGILAGTQLLCQGYGGIGVTWEHEAHLYFKRAKSTQLLLGPVSALRAEIGRQAGLLPADLRSR